MAGQQYGSGLVTGWVTTTFTGNWTTNTTYTGRSRRVGDTIECSVLVSVAGGAPGGTSAFVIATPLSLTVDETKLNSSTGFVSVGYGTILDTATRRGHLICFYDSSNGVTAYIVTTAPSTISQVSATVPVTFGDGDYVEVFFWLPITGW